MVDILHKVGIKSSSPNDVYKALTAPEGLSAWWTNDTKGDGEVGEVLQFRFGGLARPNRGDQMGKMFNTGSSATAFDLAAPPKLCLFLRVSPKGVVRCPRPTRFSAPTHLI